METVAPTVEYHVVIDAESPLIGPKSTFELRVQGSDAKEQPMEDMMMYTGSFNEKNSTVAFTYFIKEMNDIHAIQFTWKGYSKTNNTNLLAVTLHLSHIVISRGPSKSFKFSFNSTVMANYSIALKRSSSVKLTRLSLHEAAKKGSIRELAWVRTNAPRTINQVDLQSRTPLQIAIEHQQVEFVRCILEDGVLSKIVIVWPGHSVSQNERKSDEKEGKTDSKKRRSPVFTPLHEACTVADVTKGFQMVLSLLQLAGSRGGDKFVRSVIRMPDTNGWTPLHYAVRHDKYPVVAAFIKNDPDSTKMVDRAGRSPLLIGAQKGASLQTLLLLLDHTPESHMSVNVDEETGRGATIAHYLALQANKKLIDGVFNFRRLSKDFLGRILKQKDSVGRTPLLCAVESGIETGVRAITNATKQVGKEPQWFKSDDDGNGVLHLSTMHGGPPVLNFLAMQKDVLMRELERTNELGDTPLHSALRNHNEGAVKWFLSCGASTTATNRDGKNAGELIANMRLENLNNAMEQVSESVHEDSIYHGLLGPTNAEEFDQKNGKNLSSHIDPIEDATLSIPRHLYDTPGEAHTNHDSIVLYQRMRYLQRRLNDWGPGAEQDEIEDLTADEVHVKAV
eukprot:CAMPEP_0167752694 /NCGR_PEP_ID=MMETSP0110_2-20121227/7283_1 /TAXON_ID=629695 /ORGANISM="Gymnochlora sp., Strain CCMP2014" /LENGTH=620 /DNA_ID=CAMNT_0007638343 /DNA_START=161 /DNA_END=2024 /DNA_ORIENTATION=-